MSATHTKTYYEIEWTNGRLTGPYNSKVAVHNAMQNTGTATPRCVWVRTFAVLSPEEFSTRKGKTK